MLPQHGELGEVFDAAERSCSHRVKTLPRPGIEPGDGAAVDEGGELAEGIAEDVADW